MLIKALCDYADKLEESSGGKKLSEGWSEQDVHFQIRLTPDGDIASIVDIREEEKTYTRKGKEKIKLVPRKVVLPTRTQKSTICSNFIEHRPFYIFGLSYDKNGFSVEFNNDRARKSHKAFAKHEQEFFNGLNSEICTAYRRFTEKWKPEDETQNPALLQLGNDYKKSYFCFSLAGGTGRLEEDEQFIAKYNAYISEKNSEADENASEIGICGVTGERLPIARIHDKIKFPGGNTTGCVLVGMKKTAYHSYGKTLSYNSNISESVMKKYTSTLNDLLENKKHRIMIDDLVIVYFAMKANDSQECNAFSLMYSPPVDETQNMLSKTYEDALSGITTDEQVIKELEVDEDVTFYVVGMTPNSSRICQKFIYRDKFGSIIHNLIQHQRDMQIAPVIDKQIYFSSIKKELISPKATNAKVSPPLMTSIMLSAFNGSNYPNELLETVVRRVKCDSDTDKSDYIKLNRVRAGIIKACLNRKARLSGKEEDIKMTLDVNNNDPAYLCGRLFAVYEAIQKLASGGDLNRTIVDSYFASACKRPSGILPTLSQLAQVHMRKLSTEMVNTYDSIITNIMNKLNGNEGFPLTLDLDSQGKFVIGYYQQKDRCKYINNFKDRKEESHE